MFKTLTQIAQKSIILDIFQDTYEITCEDLYESWYRYNRGELGSEEYINHRCHKMEALRALTRIKKSLLDNDGNIIKLSVS